MTRERWLPIEGWPHYEVSDLGHVRSLDRVVRNINGIDRPFPGRPIVPGVTPDGYHFVRLYGPPRVVYVHHLVLHHFDRPRPAGMESRHLDDDPGHNAHTNLRWGTHSENMIDRVEHGHDPQAEQVVCLRGHQLVAPNLVPCDLPRRRCRACTVTRSTVARARRAGRPLPDFTQTANDHYRRIMGVPDAHAAAC